MSGLKSFIILTCFYVFFFIVFPIFNWKGKNGIGKGIENMYKK
jgi:hypothetical protein